MATVVEVQTAADPNDIVILSGAPKSEGLSTWWREVRQLRRGPRGRLPREAQPLPQPQPQPPTPALQIPPPSRPRPSWSTFGTRGTDSGVPSLVLASATVSATTSEESGRPPAPTAPAPAPPPLQAPLQTSAATSQAAVTRTGLLEVEVRLTARQKLQTLALGSALGLSADRMGDFTEQEIETLGQFQTAYDANRTAWFRGKRLPSLIFELVALRSDDAGAASGRRLETSICVRGLSSDDDIKKFHEVMSKSAIRRLYSGMRLSYDKTLIRRPARKIAEEYDHLPSSFGETLCGTRISTRREGHPEWSSTVGGLVLLGETLYAVTSSHKPDDNDVASTAVSLSNESSPSTLVDADYDDDVEPALILDLPYSEKPVDHGKTAAKVGVAPETPSYFWPTLTTSGPTHEEEGDDWRLIRISSNHCFPNSLPLGTEHKTTYITELFDTKPTRRKVSILSGFSGLCRGTLLSSPAFLSAHGAAPAEVWTVVLDNNTTLQKGDSGSWAVDDEGRWVGTVTAMSGGDVYLVPARLQMRQIQAQLHCVITLPAPLRCYLHLAADKSIPGDLADSFAAKALTPEVLIATASEVGWTMGRMALALAAARTSAPGPLDAPDSLDGLKALLRHEGPELYKKLTRLESPPVGLHALYSLKKRYQKLAGEGRLGSRAEIQAVLDGQTLPAPVDLWGESSITAAVASPEPEPTNEKPSKKPSWNPIAALPHGDENAHKDRISYGRAWDHLIINNIILGGMSALAGMAALATLLKLQPALRRGLSITDSSPVDALGPIAGVSLAVPLVFTAVVRLIMSYLNRRLPSWFIFVSIPIMALLFFAELFARSTIAVAVVSSMLSIPSEKTTNLFIAGLAASAPLIMDTLLDPMIAVALISPDDRAPSPEPSTRARYRKRKIGIAGWDDSLSGISRYILIYPACVGWDALAGYTFSHVARNYGFGSIQDSLGNNVYDDGAIGYDDGAAAAAGAVFGTIFLLWRPLAFTVVLLYDLCFPMAERAASGWDIMQKKMFALITDLKTSAVTKVKGKTEQSLPPETTTMTRAHTV